MKATAIGGLLLLLSLPSWGEPLTIDECSGDVDAQGNPDILITLSDNVPAELEEQVLDPANYEVVATAPLRGGDVVPAVEGAAIPISEVSFQHSALGIDRSVIVLHMSGFTYGEGEVTVQDMAAGGSSSLEGATKTWSITERYAVEPTLAQNQSFRFLGQTAVIDFSFTFGGLQWNGKNGASRFTATLEGSAPLGTPEDVEEEPGAEADASEEVADFFKLSVLSTTYAGNGRLHSYGVVARSTAQFEGLEAVGTYQFGWLNGGTETEEIERSIGLGAFFAGASVEAGYRRGDAEWTSLTQPAPDRGDIVARVGSVLEWGPKLGPINRDLGAGLRFFIRGRGWADWAKDETAEEDVRFRGFLDSELFYNISDEFRLFLRWENGYLPPDLSQRHRQTFVGVGTAF